MRIKIQILLFFIAFSLQFKLDAQPPTLKRITSKEIIDLKSQDSPSKDTLIVLNFWATWCEPCKLEMPSLDVLAEWEGEGHLQVVAIDVRETSARAERFLAQRNLHLRVIQDPDAQTAKRFRVSMYPTTILIDAKGQARWTIEGPVDWTSQEARGWIDALSRP
jgi:thiol-disulfide isomerase/thioredoxin